MRPNSQLPTTPMTLPDYKSKTLLSTSKPVAPSDLFLVHIRFEPAQKPRTRTMAHQGPRSNLSETTNGLWYNMPASARRNQEQDDLAQLSAQRATSRLSSTHSTAPPTLPPTPSTNLNKPLPPSPMSSERKSRKTGALRGFLRREHSHQPDSALLRPEPYQASQRHSTELTVETRSPYIHAHSHSMPSSPRGTHQLPYKNAEQLPRVHSPVSGFSGALQHQPHTTSSQRPPSSSPWRSVSSISLLETTTHRSRTFPETSPSPATSEAAPNRPRPHTTCLSPSEPFTDISQFHLFAEAMTGLPSEFECASPNAPPQLQGSLFARRTANDSIPLPLQHPQSASNTPPMRQPQREQRDDWQNFEPPPFVSSSAAPALNHPLSSLDRHLDSYQPWQPPPQMDGITAELELLGLNDSMRQDDELPNYQQSQAEMAELKRLEAAARARELEARWRSTRRC